MNISIFWAFVTCSLANGGLRNIKSKLANAYFIKIQKAAMINETLAGRYQIVEHIKSGGFTETYLGKDQLLPGKPKCVVKQLKPRSSDPLTLKAARDLFETEARVLDTLGNHDQIPRLLAHFEENQEFYLIEEFIDGENLGKTFTEGQKYSEQQVIQLLLDVLEVLKFVHQQNVIHRDIKPSNIIRRYSDRKIVLTGFGSVKQIHTQVVTAEGETSFTIPVGTVGFMPNEQQGGKPRYSSDIYALGITAIYALTGEPPSKLQEDHKTGEVIWRQNVQVSDGLAKVLNQMVRSHYRDRYQTVDEVLQALRNLSVTNSESSSVSEFTSESSVVNKKPNWQKLRLPLAIAAGLVVLVGVGTSVAIFNPFKLSPVVVNPTPSPTPEPTPEPEPTTAEGFVERGNKRIESGEYKEALADFEAALKLNPNLTDALSGKTVMEGFLLVNEQKTEEAIAKFDQVLTTKPNSPVALTGKAFALSALQKYDNAITFFDKAIGINPDYYLALVGKGSILSIQQKYKEAVTLYDKLIEKKPDNAYLWTLRGDNLRSLEQYKEAISSYEKAIAINQNYTDAWVGKSVALFYLGNRKEALLAIDKAVETDNNSVYAWNVRGDLLNRDGRHEGALSSFEKALNIDSKNVFALQGKSNALLKLRRLNEAIQAADEAIKFSSNFPPILAEVWNTKANALYESGRLQEALLAYRKVVQFNPNSEGGWSNLSELLNGLKNYNEALEAADKALKIKSTTSGWNQRGNALFGLGKYEAAVTAYEEVLKLNPDYHYALVSKGKSLSRLGKYKEAIAAYDKAIEIKPADRKLQEQSDQHGTWNFKAKAHLALKEYQEALNSFDEAIKIKSDFADAWLNKGITLSNLQRYKEALAAYDKVLEINPNHTGAKKNIKEVKQKLGQTIDN